MVAGLQPGETLLVHGGAGGIGTFAIQLAHALGARVLTTAGLRRRSSTSAATLGADVTINYREQDFVEEVEGGDRRRTAPTSSSTTWARSTSPATSTRSPPRAGWS